MERSKLYISKHRVVTKPLKLISVIKVRQAKILLRDHLSINFLVSIHMYKLQIFIIRLSIPKKEKRKKNKKKRKENNLWNLHLYPNLHSFNIVTSCMCMLYMCGFSLLHIYVYYFSSFFFNLKRM